MNGPATEVIFAVEESPEGGYEARALGYSIYTQAASLPGGVEGSRPRRGPLPFRGAQQARVIRLHIVKDEVIPV